MLAIDRDIQLVNVLADDVQRALCLDASDYNTLAAAVSPDIDVAVVAIGDSLEASILCTLHLKKIGVTTIHAKANSRDHAEILQAVGAQHIVYPEIEAAERLAKQIFHPNLLDFIPLAKDYLVMDLAAPDAFVGRTLAELDLRRRLDLFVIAVKAADGETFAFLPGPEKKIEAGDVLVVLGKESSIEKVEAIAGGDREGIEGIGGGAAVGPRPTARISRTPPLRSRCRPGRRSRNAGPVRSPRGCGSRNRRP